MKSTHLGLAAAALAASLSVASAGDITGKITLTGTPAPEKDLPLDPNCGKIHPTKKTRFYVTGKDAGLADTYITITKGLEGKTFPVPETPVLIDQVGCEYVPYVGGAMANQKILVRNSDPLLHNVHIIPAVPGNKASNTAQLPKQKDLEYSFPKEESFLRFKCDVHPWMFSYITISGHPFFAVSGADGTFKIANVPAGKYTVEATHRKAGKQTLEIEVPATGAKELNLTFEAK